MITVLTPTYDRAHTLERLFASLATQTDPRFEWLVVDDGSRDGTAGLLARLAAGAPFPVRVATQPNGGKHVALNTGAALAAGDWVLIVDSDDALMPGAVAAVHDRAAAHGAADLVGLCFRKCRFDGTLVGAAGLPAAPVALHPTTASRHFHGDLAYVFGREALRRRPFPVFPGEVFVPELYIWNRLGDDGRILFFPDQAIYLCEYLPDGYSANFRRNLRRNPRGFLTYYRDQFRRERAPVRKAKCLVRALQCACYLAGRKARP